jgi:hypothetical protein
LGGAHRRAKCHAIARASRVGIAVAPIERIGWTFLFWLAAAFDRNKLWTCLCSRTLRRPRSITNWWPAGERPWRPSDIFVPKLLRKISDGSYMTLGQTLCEPFGWSYSKNYPTDRAGVRLEDNDGETIRAVVCEMLERLDGNSRPDPTWMNCAPAPIVSTTPAALSAWVSLPGSSFDGWRL